MAFQCRLSSHFAESWTYSACLTVVGQCQEWATGYSSHAPLVAGHLSPCAEMLELARVQLDKLGVEAGYLPRSHPFDMSLERLPLDEPPATPDDSAPRISRKDLLAALESQEAFDKLYLELTNRAIDIYQRAGRKRSALKMHASVAALEKLRGRTAAAQRLYSHLPAHYVNGRWQMLESALLDKCAELQGKLGMSREWLLSTLALVRAGIEYDGKEWSQDHMAGADERARLASRLVDDIRTLAAKLDKDFAALAFPTFSVGIASGLGRSAEDDDGSLVKARVTNLLPCVSAPLSRLAPSADVRPDHRGRCPAPQILRT